VTSRIFKGGYARSQWWSGSPPYGRQTLHGNISTPDRAQGRHGGDRRSAKFQVHSGVHLNEPGHRVRDRWRKLLDPAVFQIHAPRAGKVRFMIAETRAAQPARKNRIAGLPPGFMPPSRLVCALSGADQLAVDAQPVAAKDDLGCLDLQASSAALAASRSPSGASAMTSLIGFLFGARVRVRRSVMWQDKRYEDRNPLR
jgi:hypothetical protein